MKFSQDGLHSVQQSPDKGGAFGNNPEEGAMPRHESRFDYINGVMGNVDTAELFFDREGRPTQTLIETLSVLPLASGEEQRNLGETISSSSDFTHTQVEEILQAAFFRPTEAQFSFETAAQGELPNKEQLALFNQLDLIEPLTVPAGSSYDVGVVFGGLLGAIESRTRFLLEQHANLGCIALLGGERPIIEGKEELKAVIGESFYAELTEANSLPKTEFEIMQCVWEAKCRQDESLRALPVIEVNSAMRVNNVKAAPGTPNTVVDLANTLTSGLQVPGLDSQPTSFLLSSSQPYALRQREDFLASMAVLAYPGLSEVSVVGYAAENTPSLKLYGTELAKWVHAQFLARYS